MTNENLLEINNIEEVIESLTEFIKEQVNTNFKKKGVVIGLSGGLDSSLIATLCVKALGSKNVFGIILPEKESNPNYGEKQQLCSEEEEKIESFCEPKIFDKVAQAVRKAHPYEEPAITAWEVRFY